MKTWLPKKIMFKQKGTKMPKMKKSELVALIKECYTEVNNEKKAKLVEGRKNNTKKPVTETKKAPAKKVAPKRGK